MAFEPLSVAPSPAASIYNGGMEDTGDSPLMNKLNPPTGVGLARVYAGRTLVLAGVVALFNQRSPLGLGLIIFGLLVGPRPYRQDRPIAGRAGQRFVVAGMAMIALALLERDASFGVALISPALLMLGGIGVAALGGGVCSLIETRDSWPSASEAWNMAENLTGGFCCLIVVLLVGCLCVTEFVCALSGRQVFESRQVALTVPLLCVPLDVWFGVALISQWTQSPVALPLAVVNRLPLVPLLLRPLPAAVWLGHFVAGAAMVTSIEGVVSGQLNPLQMSMIILVLLGFSYASNTFLLAAVGSLTRNPKALDVTWRLRLVADVAVAVGLPALRFLGRR